MNEIRPNFTETIAKLTSIMSTHTGSRTEQIDEMLGILNEEVSFSCAMFFKIVSQYMETEQVFKRWHSWAPEGEVDNSYLAFVTSDIKKVIPPTYDWALLRQNKPICIKLSDVAESMRSRLPDISSEYVYIHPVLCNNVLWGVFIINTDYNLEAEASIEIQQQAHVLMSLIANVFIINNDKLIEGEAAMYRALSAVEGSGIGVWDLDINKNAMYLSPMANIYLARKPVGEVITFEEFMGEVSYYNLYEVNKFFKRCIDSSGEIITLEFSRDVAGIMRTISVRGKLVKHPVEGTLHIAGIFQEITAQKTRDEELRKALAVAEVANEAKGAFLAAMSHEIRTPLNGMLGFITLLKDYVKDEVGADYLKIINSSAESLIDIINSVLDFAKIESDKMSIEYKETDLASELEGIAKLYVASSQEKHIKLYTYIDAIIPKFVKYDQLRVRQVLTNLLNNAVKFTGEGGTIYFKARVISKYEKTVKVAFSVEDSGIGMAKDYLANIFKPFTQADSSVSRKFGGSGLGLSIAHRLVDLMGGSLEVDSLVNVGTKFHFVLDFEYTEDVARYVYDQESVTVGYLNEANDFLDEMCETLRAINVKCKCFTSADDMLAAAPSFDVFQLVDLFINHEKLEILKKVKEANPDIKLILSSYSASPDILKELDELGAVMSAYPLSSATLYNTICRALQGANFTKAAEATSDIPFYDGVVLIAEDNEINAKLITIMLNKYGITCEVVENGELALEKVRENHSKYNLVLMDINMPVMDGIAATKAIRREEQTTSLNKLPIVALTANAMKEDALAVIEAGMASILTKPIIDAKLHEVLAKYLKKA